MPLYDKICKSCNEVFEVFASMANNNKANSEPCPKCGVLGFVESMVSPINVADPVRLGLIKPSSQFTDTLNRIHARTAGSQLDKISNITKVTNQ